MNTHPFFDLILHTDDELSVAIGEQIVERVTLHVWPLSCVQKIVTASGVRHVYKSQRAPSVEAAFYRAARSPLLVAVRPLHETEEHACLLIDWIDGPRLRDLDWAGVNPVELSNRCVMEVGEIDGRPPVYESIGGAAWPGFMAEVLERLEGLIRAGTFPDTALSLTEKLAQWAVKPDVLALAGGRSRLIHGDLTADNLFLQDGALRVIDWQFPRIGPPALDRANLLLSLGVDPQAHTPPATLELLYFVRLAWFAACAARWFPPGAPTYEKQIAALARKILAPSPG